MTEEEQRPSRISRRIVTTAAPWSVPVVMVSVAAPAYASSEPAYGITARESIGPEPANGGGTYYVIYVENLGNEAIPANTLQMKITIPFPTSPEPYFLSGYSGSTTWTELNPYPPDYDGRYRTFVWGNALPSRADGPSADPYTSQLVLYFLKVPLTRTDTPVAPATISTAFVSIDFPLSIPY